MSPITRETLAARIATLEADSNISIKEGFYLQTMRLLLAEMDKPAPHHNGMMQLSNELASVKEALRCLSAFARSHAGDIQYTGDHPIAVAEKLAGRELYGNAEQLDTAQAQFESLAGEPVSQPYKLPFEQWLSQQSEKVDVDCGCVSIEVLMCWMRKAYVAGNYPVTPDGWVMVPKEMAPEMMRAVQIGSELGAYAAANLSGAYGLFAEFWGVACRAAGNSPEIPEGSITLSPEGAQLLAEIIGGHAAVVTFLTMGRPDLALEESSKWVEGIDQAAEMVKAQEAKS